MWYKLSSQFVVLSALLISCKPTTHKLPPSADSSPFKKTLIKKNIPGFNYYISLPASYNIKESWGPGFSVYYFYPADITNKTAFYGGILFGNAPGNFAPPNDSCKKQSIKAQLFGQDKNWTLYNCNNKYKVQVISACKSDYSWAQYIHAFGTCLSKTELNKLLDVYSTLNNK